MDSIVDHPRLAPYRLIADPPALKRAGLFAVEGRLVVPQLLASRYRVHSVLVSENAFAPLERLLTAREDIDTFVVPREIVSDVGGIDFHRGALALGYRDAPRGLEEVLSDVKPGIWSLEPLLVLEGISNPDNVGGIFRSAHAFGAHAVLFGPDCGDPLYRKAIRTSMGTALHVPWTELAGWPGDLATLRRHSYRLITLSPDRAAPPLRDVLAASDAAPAFLLGSEGHGLSPAALAAADTMARIPMPRNSADSLNVAAAASIALYEASASKPQR